MTTDQRFRRLSTILNDPPRAEGAGTTSADTASGDVVTENVPQQTAHTTPAQAAASGTTGGTRRVPFRLPSELHRALVDHARVQNRTHADVVFDAIETAHAAEALTSLVHTAPDAATAGPLFTRQAGRRRAQAAVPTEIRTDVASLAVLDELVATHDASSRTHLIVAALAAYLQP